MSLNPLSKEENVRTSLKKFFVDLYGNAVTFDVSLASPDVRSQSQTAIKKWYNVDFGPLGIQDLAEFTFEVYCLTRQDPEGVELTRMVDDLRGNLVDNTLQDGLKRIPLYDVSQTPWLSLTNMMVQDIWDTPTFGIKVEDETKLKVLSVRLRWGAKI